MFKLAAAVLAPFLTFGASPPPVPPRPVPPVVFPQSSPPPVSVHERSDCHAVQLQENSGNGPDRWWFFCGGLRRPGPGHHWIAIVDGGPLVEHGRLVRHAVIFFYRVPNA